MSDELMQEFETKFNEMKKELGFKATLDQLDDVFFIRDFVQQAKFVSNKPSRAVCARMVDTFQSWAPILQNILMPNPGSLVTMTEGKPFGEEDKKEASKLLCQIMELTRRHNLIGLTKDKKEEGKFIDDAYKFWTDISKTQLIPIMKKLNEAWKKEAKEGFETV
jgi:hypothetical protein